MKLAFLGSIHDAQARTLVVVAPDGAVEPDELRLVVGEFCLGDLARPGKKGTALPRDNVIPQVWQRERLIDERDYSIVVEEALHQGNQIGVQRDLRLIGRRVLHAVLNHEAELRGLALAVDVDERARVEGQKPRGKLPQGRLGGFRDFRRALEEGRNIAVIVVEGDELFELGLRCASKHAREDEQASEQQHDRYTRARRGEAHRTPLDGRPDEDHDEGNGDGNSTSRYLIAFEIRKHEPHPSPWTVER